MCVCVIVSPSVPILRVSQPFSGDTWRNGTNIRLGQFGTPCIIQLFLGTPLIDIHEKLHSSSQNSKTRAGAGLDDINMDQSETRHIRSGF